MSDDSKPTTALPTGASHRRSSSGISDAAAQTAHDFMTGTMRRSSSGVTDDAAKSAREVSHLHDRGLISSTAREYWGPSKSSVMHPTFDIWTNLLLC